MLEERSDEKQSGGRQRMTRLNLGLERKVALYAVSATAAGVGALALSIPAEAKVVYTGGNVPILLNGGALALDLNHDGATDFSLSNFSYVTHGIGSRFLKLSPSIPANEFVVASNRSHLVAAAMSTKQVVGSQAGFQRQSQGLYMAHYGHGRYTYTYFGSWSQVQTAYLGFQFEVDGQIHYGWARIKYDWPFGAVTAAVSGYAYEDIPNKPINTGDTGTDPALAPPKPVFSSQPTRSPSFGMLAVGASGLRLWRPQLELPNPPSVRSDRKAF